MIKFTDNITGEVLFFETFVDMREGLKRHYDECIHDDIDSIMDGDCSYYYLEAFLDATIED